VARVVYGSIINPGVRPLSGSGVSAVGPKDNPSTVVVAHNAGLHVGQIVTSGSTAELPSGLVSRITAIKSGRSKDTLFLKPVPVTDAVPVIDTGAVTPTTDQAETSALLGLKVESDISRACGLSAQDKLTPIVRLDGMNVNADIRATPWGGGPKADLVVSSHWMFGFKLETTGAVSCAKEVAAPEIPFDIPVGPVVVPAYVAMPVTADISLSGETTAQATYSWESQIGMRTHRAGPLLIPKPVFDVSHPSANLSISTTPKISVEGGVDLEVGLGIRSLKSDIFFKAGTSLEAALEPSNCHLDWKLGNFSAGGRAGPFSISTPDFTAVTHRVWTGCGSGPGSGGGPPTHPPPTENPNIHLGNLSFGALPTGQQTIEHLTASGGTPPYSFAIWNDPGNVANVPSWVNVASDGIVTIDPPAGTNQSVSFYVYASDATGQHSPFKRDQIAFSVSGGGGGGMSWTAIGLPVPAGGEAGSAFYSFGVFSQRVACSTAGICVLAGSYYDTNGFRHSMIETFADGTWTATQPPVPAGGEAGSADFSSSLVACSSADLCLVSGEYQDNTNGFRHSMIETLVDGTWTATQPPVPAGGEAGSAWFGTLACPGAGFCVASGSYGTSSGLVETLVDDTWTPTAAPSYGDGAAGGVDYSTLTCSNPDSCVELGYDSYPGSREEYTLIETFADGTWTATQPPVPAGGEAGSALLSKLACSPAGPCVALGEYRDASSGRWTGLIETFADGTWTATQPPVPAGGEAGSGTLGWRTLACSTMGTCMAFGYYHDTSGGSRNMVDTFANGTWTVAEAPVAAGGKAGSIYIEEVSCPTANSCVAFGDYNDTFGNEHDLIETLADGTWRAIQPPVPAGGEAGSGGLVPLLACSAGGACVGIGHYKDTSGQWQGMIETLADGIWTATQRPVPAGGVSAATASAPALACSAVGTCVIIDTYEDTSGSLHDMIETGKSGP